MMRAIDQTSGNKIVDSKISDWSDWSPSAYLQTYFNSLKGDAIENLKFLHRELTDVCRKQRVKKIMDFGCGPTIFAGLISSKFTDEFHCCDFLECNLLEIRKWLTEDDESFDWSDTIRHILLLEKQEISEENIQGKKEELKRKLKRIQKSDASICPPIASGDSYPIVISNFCADSATHNKAEWAHFMCNIFSLLDEEGIILFSALRNCKQYRNGGHFFPSANINEIDILELLSKNFFDLNATFIEIVNVPECISEGFESIIFVRSQRRKKSEIKKLAKKISRKHLIHYSKISSS